MQCNADGYLLGGERTVPFVYFKIGYGVKAGLGSGIDACGKPEELAGDQQGKIRVVMHFDPDQSG